MTNTLTNSDTARTAGWRFLEYTILAVCLCVIALRATFVESPNITGTAPAGSSADAAYSLAISGVVIFCAILFLVCCFCSRSFQYRRSGMELPLVLFLIAGFIAISVASNTRAAINDFVTILAPVLMAALLVQLLDSEPRIKLLLYIITAVGVTAAFQCVQQFFNSNQMLIEQYEQDPNSFLVPLGLRAGSYHHMLFEHRLYSKDVSGFFTTSNSAGSFLLLACFAAIALFIEKIKNYRSGPTRLGQVLTCGLAVIIIILGLAITRSKGALAAAFISAIMFIVYLLFGNYLRTHKKLLVVFCLVLVIAAACSVVWYGSSHGRLPGGKSMLVRWQYWVGAARMYAEHPFTGVGGGNFSSYYPHYKIPSAPETVTDPHNFVLSILTQYGPLGLIALLTAIFVPLLKAISTANRQAAQNSGQSFGKMAVSFLIIISIAMLIFRPIFVPSQLGNSAEAKAPAVIFYVIFVLYFIPAVVFMLALLLLSTTEKTTRIDNTTLVAVFCGVIGFLVHNCIDFAIFEPGVSTTFWASIACIIAISHRQSYTTTPVIIPTGLTRIVMLAVCAAGAWAYLHYALIPVWKSTAKIEQAKLAAQQGAFNSADSLLEAATETDRFSPAALLLNAQITIQRLIETEQEQTQVLSQAIEYIKAAIQRDRENYKNYEKLGRTYNLLAGKLPAKQRGVWFQEDFESMSEAVKRFPGCGRLRFELAKIAEQLDRKKIAVYHYKKAVEIEDSYRIQFRQMYGSRKLFSRLGEGKYQFAKKRVVELQANH